MALHTLTDSGLCGRTSAYAGHWMFTCSCGAGFVAPTYDEAAEGFRDHVADPVMCEAKDCPHSALTTWLDGAGRELDLCEDHGDLLAVGFPLRAGGS